LLKSVLRLLMEAELKEEQIRNGAFRDGRIVAVELVDAFLFCDTQRKGYLTVHDVRSLSSFRLRHT
jgi:hypothetical protein